MRSSSKALLKLSPLEALYAKRPIYYETKKLEVRCKEVGFDLPTYQPIDNNCVCYRLPDIELSKGGIFYPGKDRAPHLKGILVAVGPRARDVLFSNGIEVGDVVIWGRFSGWEHQDKTATKDLGAEFIVLKDRDIMGSDDLDDDLAHGRAKYILDPETGRHNLVKGLLGPASKKQKLLALAASTNSAHEAETARRLANQEK